jgi:glycosyltransferase involved in cell wall biosynthesis
MPPLRISVITPSYNQAGFLGRTVRSVLDQRGDFDLEYIVIDGGSADDSLEVLRRNEDPRMVWTSEPEVGGQIDTVNSGLRRASGDVVGWLNSDDVLVPGALARVAACFEADPGLEWVHGRCDIIDRDDRVIRRPISGYKHRRCLRYSYDRLIVENFISQMTVFWRRSLLDRAGFLESEHPLAFDYDLWLRFARCSAPLYIPEPVACFRWYESSKSGRGYRRQFAEDFAIALRHSPGRHWLHLRKLAKSAQIYAVYESMALARAVGRPWRGGAPRRSPGAPSPSDGVNEAAWAP